MIILLQYFWNKGYLWKITIIRWLGWLLEVEVIYKYIIFYIVLIIWLNANRGGGVDIGYDSYYKYFYSGCCKRKDFLKRKGYIDYRDT